VLHQFVEIRGWPNRLFAGRVVRLGLAGPFPCREVVDSKSCLANASEILRCVPDLPTPLTRPFNQRLWLPIHGHRQPLSQQVGEPGNFGADEAHDSLVTLDGDGHDGDAGRVRHDLQVGVAEGRFNDVLRRPDGDGESINDGLSERREGNIGKSGEVEDVATNGNPVAVAGCAVGAG
jgi:hypothetical protein